MVVGTVFVVALVVAQQVFTILENERLSRRQADALERLERANTQIEEQARVMSNRNAELEIGVQHLKDVQARLANGNLRARASLTSGELLPTCCKSQLDGGTSFACRTDRCLCTCIERGYPGIEYGNRTL